jgi:hypothetical protein
LLGKVGTPLGVGLLVEPAPRKAEKALRIVGPKRSEFSHGYPDLQGSEHTYNQTLTIPPAEILGETGGLRFETNHGGNSVPKIFYSSVIPSPIDRVWAPIRDFNKFPCWHPAVCDSSEENRPSDAVGCVRSLYLKSGGHFRFALPVRFASQASHPFQPYPKFGRKFDQATDCG